MADKRPSLNVLSGPLAGRRFVLEQSVDSILIGSDPSCGFVLDTPGVSPMHARLWVDLNGAIVYDTNSAAGVFVNDDRVVKEAPVRNGDILWLGPPGEEGSVLIQCIFPPSPPAVPAPAPPAKNAARPSPSGEDSGATMAFGVPAYMADEPEFEPQSPAQAIDDSDIEPTVVMSSEALLEGVGRPQPAAPEPEPEPTIAERPETSEPEPAPVIDGPAISSSALVVEEAGFPDFDVEPTVVMGGAPVPPPVPPPIPRPPASAAPATPEFEEDMEPTMVDAAKVEEDAHGVEPTVMLARTESPVAPPPKPPPIPPRPPVPAAAPKPPSPSAPPAVPRPAPPARPTEAKPAAPRPAPARPAAPTPRARTERPAAAAPAMAAPRRKGGSGRGALMAAAGVVVAALAFGAYWFLRPAPGPVTQASPVAPPPASQATPPPVAAAPVTEAAAPPVTEAAAPVVTTPTPIPEAVTVVRSPVPSPRVAAIVPTPPPNVRPGASAPPGQRPPTAAPAATPVPAANPAQQNAAAITNLMAQARTASDARNYDAAIAMYDEVLKLDPQSTAAVNARTAALAARTAATASRKTFVAGRTVVQTEQKAKAITGFDSSDVSIKSPDFNGRLELAMTPATLKSGESYRLQIALVNEGKKPIKISGMTYSITVNGQKTGNPIAPKVKEVAPQQRAVLEELPGVFPDATSWVAEVLVTANKGDSLKNQITWK